MRLQRVLLGIAMKKPIYLFSDGVLKRKDNTLLFITQEDRRTLPIHAVSQIHAFGEIELNKRVLELLTAHQIPLHFYNYYGYYSGSFYPRESLNSGLIILEQARCYLDKSERLYLARRFVQGALQNIQKNIAYYLKRSLPLGFVKEEITKGLEKIEEIEEIDELMALEGNVRRTYYKSFDTILDNEDFSFEVRTKRPPQNALNALISFGNALLYTTALSEIYRTHLDPRIGYLHETNQRSFSLNLDLAEIFKPILVDRTIFALVNKKMINLNHFERDVGYAYLNEQGRKIFVQAFEERLQTTIQYKNIGKVSYRRLIRLECYKLYKHFLGEDIYQPFVARW